MRLTVGHLKGGTGKTTTAVHLALGLARSGRTLLVDADPDQDGALAWSQEAADWPADQCIVIDDKCIGRSIIRHAIILDTNSQNTRPVP